MRKLLKTLALAAVAVVGAVSCSESGTNDDVQPTFEGVTITAAIPSSETVTKVAFAEGEKGIDLNWEEGDRFELYDGETLIDTFTTEKGDGSFKSKNENLQLTDGTTYTAKFNGEATTAVQDGDKISDLSGACQMEAEFTYNKTGGISIVFAHTKAIMTFKFASEERPAKLVFKNGDVEYAVNYTDIVADETTKLYTSYIMIEPCDATERELTFSLYKTDATEPYDVRTTPTNKEYKKGRRYISPISILEDEVFFSGGVGTQEKPYLISTTDDIYELSERVNGGNSFYGKYLVMTNYIALKDSGFVAIGTADNYFCGTFDGANYLVDGLQINNHEANCQGLFGFINLATIKNIQVNGSVTAGTYIAGVVGYASNSSVINCLNSALVDGDVINRTSAGGVVGIADNSSVVNCKNRGVIKGKSSVGGVVGFASSSSTVANCHNEASVSGLGEIGGVVGKAGKSSVTTCYNAASVTSSISGRSGNIVGLSDSSSSVTNCYWPTDIENIPAEGIASNSGKATNVKGMTTTAMQSFSFMVTLNNNAYAYNRANTDKPQACEWVIPDNRYPILDYGSSPKFTQFEEITDGVELGE